jgi:hypothetical protein
MACASLLAVAVCVVLAGATMFAAIGDWAADLDPPPGAGWGSGAGVPAGTALWRFFHDLVRVATEGPRCVRRVRTDIPKPQPMVSKYPGQNPETAFCAGVRWSLVISITDGSATAVTAGNSGLTPASRESRLASSRMVRNM